MVTDVREPALSNILPGSVARPEPSVAEAR
jgi:hypothetical protein